MRMIEVQVTMVPRAGGTVLLLACSACGPVGVDSGVTSTPTSVGAAHLLEAHGLLGKVRS